MEVVRITPRGYCHGVVEAIRIAKRVGAERSAQGPVTMLGYLVHNEHVTRELQEAGVALVEESDRMKGLDQVRMGLGFVIEVGDAGVEHALREIERHPAGVQVAER